MSELEMNINRTAIELYRYLRAAGTQVGMRESEIDFELDRIDGIIEGITLLLNEEVSD